MFCDQSDARWNRKRWLTNGSWDQLRLDNEQWTGPFFYEKSSIFALYLIFTTKQQESLDSVCSKTNLSNWCKRGCKLWKFTTVQVCIMSKGFSATKKYGLKTTNHSQLAWPFELHLRQTQWNVACDWFIFFRSQMCSLAVSDRLILSSWFNIAFPQNIILMYSLEIPKPKSRKKNFSIWKQ